MDVATRIGICQRDHKLKMAVDDYVEQFHFNLMEVVHEWAKGLVSMVNPSINKLMLKIGYAKFTFPATRNSKLFIHSNLSDKYWGKNICLM